LLVVLQHHFEALGEIEMRTALHKEAITNRQTPDPGKYKTPVGRAIVIVGFAMSAATPPSCLAFAQVPPAPPEITPPTGNALFLTTHAVGTQNYICLPSTSGGNNTWVFFAPQATVSVTLPGRFSQQVATHFLSPAPGVSSSAPPACTLSSETNEVNCPTWQSSLDSSAVWGARVAGVTAGTDASCPNTGAIPCLLLKAVATRRGQNDFGLLTKTTYIQRLNTTGGAAPTASCKVGDQALVPYQADYSFYTTEHGDSGKGEKP